MLHNLFAQHIEICPFLNVFKYITFRTLLAFLTSFSILLLFGDKFIAFLRRLNKDGQPIRLDGPETHFSKKGTPTMGGLLIVIAVLVSTILWGDLTNINVLALLVVFIGYAIIGFADDYQKVSKKNHHGISGRQKLFWQFLIGALGCMIIIAANGSNYSTTLAFPFFKNILLDLGYFYIVFTTVVVVGSSNAVNLTDGLDGLAIGPVILCCICFGLIAYLVGHAELADYLKLIKVNNASELAVLMGAIIGAGLGFLWFNSPPAQIMMGDVGSLSLGGAIGITAVATKHELLLAIVGGVFVVEAVSVIIQVASFKLRGKRIFKMAPLHHHFEKLGWPETKVVFRFWILAIIFAVIGISSLKLR